MSENAMSNANDRSMGRNKNTSLSPPVAGAVREVGWDGAGNAGSGDAGIDGNYGQGSTASDIVKTQGCFGEPVGSHVLFVSLWHRDPRFSAHCS